VGRRIDTTSLIGRSTISLPSGMQEVSFDLEVRVLINDLLCTHVLALKQ